VFVCVCGNHPIRADNGAYAAYVAAVGDLMYLLPPHLSYAEGASLGAAMHTQWHAGAADAATFGHGTFSCLLARQLRHGHGRGADVAFDYHDASCADDIGATQAARWPTPSTALPTSHR
jgi:hypothetical protein